MSKLRLMTQNLWSCTKNNDAWAALGLDCSAEVRMKANVKIFEALLPDIVGGQEINKDMQMHLQLALAAADLPYTLIWGNDTPILYRADKFELLDTEFLLFPRYMEGLEGEVNNANTKSLCIGVFRAKEDGRVFAFATTHLWWKKEHVQKGSDEARRRQIALVIEKLEAYAAKYGGCPAILVGDMNAFYTDPAIQYALSEGGFAHAHDIATDFRHEGRGYNACGPKGPGVWQDRPFETALDHILVKHVKENAISRFDRYCPDYYLTISDHAPAYIDIKI